MALEDFIPHAKSWSIDIVDGPDEKELFKYQFHIIYEGIRPKDEEEPQFEVMLAGHEDTEVASIDGLQIGPAYRESSIFESSVVYIRGELEIAPSPSLIFPTVEGLYHIKNKNGGLFIVERSEVATQSQYRFK
ncbi:MAG: hypothetical protein R3251_03145 [Candidatus Spechtbacterales bacterium]|nr:hypothetical protein [Candidatus Spechtbacterales bacterium]